MDYNNLLAGFKELYEKQDMLSKLTEQEFLHGYGCSDIHCVDLVGKQEQVNVTRIAEGLNMTRGAASKITKRLLEKGVLHSYRLPDNRKEIYFSLTAEGERLYIEHKRRHMLWEERDLKFLKGVPEAELLTVNRFIGAFNKYLNEQIEEYKE